LGRRHRPATRIRWRDVKPALRVVEIPGAKASNTIQIVMSAPIARVLKRARDLGKPKDRDAFVFAALRVIFDRSGRFCDPVQVRFAPTEPRRLRLAALNLRIRSNVIRQKQIAQESRRET